MYLGVHMAPYTRRATQAVHIGLRRLYLRSEATPRATAFRADSGSGGPGAQEAAGTQRPAWLTWSLVTLSPWGAPTHPGGHRDRADET